MSECFQMSKYEQEMARQIYAWVKEEAKEAGVTNQEAIVVVAMKDYAEWYHDAIDPKTHRLRKIFRII